MRTLMGVTTSQGMFFVQELTEFGYDVSVVHSGEEVLRLLPSDQKEHIYYFVILDSFLVLSALNGNPNFLKELKDRLPLKKRSWSPQTQVMVICTEYYGQQSQLERFKGQVDAVIHHPVSSSDIRIRLSSLKATS